MCRIVATLVLLCGLLGTPMALWAQDTHQTLPSATRSDFNTVLQHYLRTEPANRLADATAQHGWVVQTADPANCLAVASGSRTLAPFACAAYTNNGYYATQVSAGIDLSAVPGPACATEDLAWVIITDGLSAPGGNFTQVFGTQYAVDCASATQPDTPSNATMLFLAHIVGGAAGAITDLRPKAPGLPSALLSQGGATVAEEARIWWGDAARSFVAEGCLHGISASPEAVITTCRAYVRDTAVSPPQMHAVKAPPSRLVAYNAGDGVYWLLLHASLTDTVTGWTREPGTPYLWRHAAFQVGTLDSLEQQPAVPNKGILLAKLLIQAGAITHVGDLRVEGPYYSDAVNVMAPIFGAQRDCVSDDHDAIQAAVNNAAWRGIYRVYLPASPIGRCYLTQSTIWISWNAAANPNHPGVAYVALDANIEFSGDKPIYFNAQGGIRTTGTLLTGTGDYPLLKSDSGHNVNGARLLTIQNMAFRGAGTTTPVLHLEGAAGITMDKLSIWQSGEGGSGIWMIDYDRPVLREIVLEGPRVATGANPPTAGSRGIWMRGTGTDNSGSLLESVHMRGFDRCLQIGHETPITTINNNAILFTVNSNTLLNCNIGVWLGDGASHMVFNSLQNNGMFDTAISLGDAATQILFVGGTINASTNGIHIGRGSTQADAIRVMGMRISNIENTGTGIKIDSIHSLSGRHIIEGVKFSCRNGLGTAFVLTGAPKGGIMDLNTNTDCANYWGGSHASLYTLFDRVTMSESATNFNTPFVNIGSKIQFRDALTGAKGILELWEATANLNFPVVLAETCSTALTIAAPGVLGSNNHYPIWIKPDLSTLGLRADMSLATDLISIKLCNDRGTNSADPPNGTYGATILRVQ
jgi:hypothetical protein